MNTYTYPTGLVEALGELGWKVNSRWRQGWFDTDAKGQVVKWEAYQFDVDRLKGSVKRLKGRKSLLRNPSNSRMKNGKQFE
jgi:hypothetical protein